MTQTEWATRQGYSACLITLAVLLLTLMPLSLLKADTVKQALIVLSADKPPYHQVANIISNFGPSVAIETVLEQSVSSSSGANLHTADLIIAIGSSATDIVLNLAPKRKSILSTFLPRSSYEQLYQQHHNRIVKQQLSLSAIFLDQPYSRQMTLAKIINPKAEQLGVILGPDSSKNFYHLHQEARKQQLNLYSDTLNAEDNPVQRLKPIMDKSDIFLALPDQTIFNRTTAKWLLYMSLRKRVPLIAFSRNYVRSGALAAVISTPENIGQHAVELLSQFQKNGRLPEPDYCRYFTVTINRKIAQQMQLTIPDDSTIRQLLQKASER